MPMQPLSAIVRSGKFVRGQLLRESRRRISYIVLCSRISVKSLHVWLRN